MPELTKQEIFDTVCQHLMTQKAKSVGVDNTCMYRSPKGLKCAAGCLIADEDYNPYIEGFTINVSPGYSEGAVIVRNITAKSGLDSNIGFVRTLQNIHDRFDVENWSRELINVGYEEELNIPNCLL